MGVCVFVGAHVCVFVRVNVCDRILYKCAFVFLSVCMYAIRILYKCAFVCLSVRMFVCSSV